MRRCIARREDEPKQPTALILDQRQICYPCLEAGAVRYLEIVQETKTIPEAKIGQGGGVAIIQMRRLFVGYRCSRPGCPNHDRILEPEKVYLDTSKGFLLQPEED